MQKRIYKDKKYKDDWFFLHVTEMIDASLLFMNEELTAVSSNSNAE